MSKQKLIRITTVPLSLEKLLEGQLAFMNDYYEVIAVSSDKVHLENYGKNEGVGTFHVSLTRKITPFRDLVSVFKLVKFFKKEKPLIVHTHTPKAGIVGMLAAYLAKVPIRLHTVAGLPLMEASGLKRKILNTVEILTYRFATGVYPNSKGLYDFILENGFTKAHKLKIIGNGSSNGIDATYFDPKEFSEKTIQTTRNELGIPLEDFVFIFVGRIVADKGINELIAAFSKLFKTEKSVSLLLVGPLEADLDPLLPETSELITAHPKIFTVGYKEDVRPYFVSSNALVFPSYREGFPNVVLQAGAMGLPGIVTNINGCNEIISEGINGMLIPVKHSDAIYNAMKKLIADKNLVVNLSKNARKEIISKYKREEICRALLTEYRDREAML
ncbi:MAG: glycosyltransferase family 4 protein [Altibacter sp.]|uniref:glycosyltransferase family 4 protein n=1 Tax=Altibacter sp. TaxID=2024823 RepID=UPI001D5C52CF|nr:glycosyltransferase family 4 protein [Altibacter sp.]MBZ0327466.1 glycosyltransferase family 4 protein [Altibacter sp.]